MQEALPLVLLTLLLAMLTTGGFLFPDPCKTRRGRKYIDMPERLLLPCSMLLLSDMKLPANCNK